MRLTYLPRAEQGLERIADYGEARWGKDKTRDYIDYLIDKISILTKFPDLGSRYVTDNAELEALELKRYVLDGHQVFYKKLPDRIAIFAIVTRGELDTNWLG